MIYQNWNGMLIAWRRSNMNHWDKPCAISSLTSYRYKGRYGWIMIGAKNTDGALSEAKRSTQGVIIDNLQVWDGSQYKGVTNDTK